MSYLEEGCKMGCLMGIIFGAVGFFVAGPVGAIIGLLIGILGAVGENVDEVQTACTSDGERSPCRLCNRRP